MYLSNPQKNTFKNFTLIELVGQGQFGKVYKAQKVRNQQDKYNNEQLSNKQYYALKVIPKNKIRQHPKLKTLIINQVQILQKLAKHPNILSFQQIFIHNQQTICMVYQFCDLGTLQQRLPLPQAKVIKLLKCLVQALIFAQQKNILHRDIKPANILFKSIQNFQENQFQNINKKNYQISQIFQKNQYSIQQKDSFQIVKLADWGFSRLINPNQTTQSFIGSPVYMAPQILQENQYDSKADIWSLGIVTYQCLYGKCPWEGVTNVQDLKSAISDKKIKFSLIQQGKVDEELQKLILNMLKVNPHQRICLKQIKQKLLNIQRKRSLKIKTLKDQNTQDNYQKYKSDRFFTKISKEDELIKLNKHQIKFLLSLFKKIKSFLKSDKQRFCLVNLIYKQFNDNNQENPQCSLKESKQLGKSDRKVLNKLTSSPSFKKKRTQTQFSVQKIKQKEKAKTSKKQIKMKKPFIQKEQSTKNGIEKSRTTPKVFQLLSDIRYFYLSRLEKDKKNQQSLFLEFKKSKYIQIIIKSIMSQLQNTISLFQQRANYSKQQFNDKTSRNTLNQKNHKNSFYQKINNKISYLQNELKEQTSRTKIDLQSIRSQQKINNKNFKLKKNNICKEKKVQNDKYKQKIKNGQLNKNQLKSNLINLNLILDIITYKQMQQQFERFRDGQIYIEQLNAIKYATSKSILMRLLNHKLLYIHKKYCLE